MIHKYNFGLTKVMGNNDNYYMLHHVYCVIITVSDRFLGGLGVWGQEVNPLWNQSEKV